MDVALVMTMIGPLSLSFLMIVSAGDVSGEANFVLMQRVVVVLVMVVMMYVLALLDLRVRCFKLVGRRHQSP